MICNTPCSPSVGLLRETAIFAVDLRMFILQRMNIVCGAVKDYSFIMPVYKSGDSWKIKNAPGKYPTREAAERGLRAIKSRQHNK